MIAPSAKAGGAFFVGAFFTPTCRTSLSTVRPPLRTNPKLRALSPGSPRPGLFVAPTESSQGLSKSGADVAAPAWHSAGLFVLLVPSPVRTVAFAAPRALAKGEA